MGIGMGMIVLSRQYRLGHRNAMHYNPDLTQVRLIRPQPHWSGFAGPTSCFHTMHRIAVQHAAQQAVKARV